MFDIRVLPVSELGPDGQRLGRITIGDFTERFACHDTNLSVDDFGRTWTNRLKSLSRGHTAVALVHDPRFAWIVYREGDQCYVQQILRVDGRFEPVPPRKTVGEDGDRISEWPVSLQAITEFVKKQPVE